jgi:hypothetical protein
MKRLFSIIITAFFILLTFSLSAKSIDKEKLIFVCEADNDLYKVATESFGIFERSNSIKEAIDKAPTGAGLLILADNYPEKTVGISAEEYRQAEGKSLRIFVEFPSNVPEYKLGDIEKTEWERCVISSDLFGEHLEKMRIVMVHDCHYIPVKAKKPHIVVAKVAGFDNAVYGLKKTKSHPILFEHKKRDILVSTTKLSQFVSARYAPKEAWASVWQTIFNWLQPGSNFSDFNWTPTVNPSFYSDEILPDNALDNSIKKGVDWYSNSRMLMDESWSHMWDEAAEYKDRVAPAPSQNLPVGSGKLGVLEGFSSSIKQDGGQPIRWYQRADCSSESSMAIAIQGLISNDKEKKEIAANIQDFIYFSSNLQAGPRADSDSPSYGLIGWDTREAGAVIYYGDDNARVILGSLLASTAIESNKWDEAIIKNILANFRTTGPTGFRERRIEEPDLQENGWEHYWNTEHTHYAPHFQSWMWACYLWLYNKTGFEPLLERSKEGIRNMMQAYPNEWHWTNGLQQERARMLLTLAWLVRIEDTKEHRDWLWQIANDLLSHQDKCGAIREELGSAGHGSYGPPKSNRAYGTSETPLIQENGDPLADMLYTSNFALFSLTEAAYATNNDKLKEAAAKLAEFFIRIQVKSETRPELDGVWYRAFDYNRWEYWASNGDAGWGAWSTETGWTQGWITTMLAMQKLQTSYWDITSESKIAEPFNKIREEMLPDSLINN